MSGDDSAIAQKREQDHGNLIEEAKFKGKKIVFCGVGKHTNSLAEVSDILAVLEKFGQDKIEKIVFSEANTGEVARRLFEENSTLELGAVTLRHGEQVAIAYRAMQLGIETGAWDMTFKEQLELAVDKFGAEASGLWFLSQALISMKNLGKEFTRSNVLGLIEEVTGVSADEVGRIFKGVLDDPERLLELFLEKLGYNFDQVMEDEAVQRQFTRLADPTLMEEQLGELSEGEREVARISGAIGKIRDEIGMRRIKNQAEQGKNVLVACGRTHAEHFLDEFKKPNRLKKTSGLFRKRMN